MNCQWLTRLFYDKDIAERKPDESFSVTESGAIRSALYDRPLKDLLEKEKASRSPAKK